MIIAAAERAGTFIPRFCYHPRMKPVGMCRMCLVEVSGPRGATLQPSCFVEVQAGIGGGRPLRQGQEGPGRRARVPAHQPPARLPGVRQGRRVPPPGPDPGLRPGRDPLRRGEAPLREAHPHLRSGAARPGAVHPVQPLHPVRRRGGRRGPDRLPRPRRAARGQHLPRTAPSPPTSPATPCRSARWAPSPPRPTGSPPGPGTSTRSSSTCTTCAVGCRVAVQSSANRVTRLLGHRRRSGQPRLAVRQGAVRLRVGQRRASAWPSPSSARRASWCRPRGTRRWPPPPTALHRGEPQRPEPVTVRGVASAVHRRGPADQRGGLRLGQAGQGGARHRLGRRPAGRRPPRRGRARACPGPPSTRRPRPTRSSSCSPATSARSCPSSSSVCGPPSSTGRPPSVELSPQATSLTPYAAVSLRYVPGEATALVRAARPTGRRPTTRAGRGRRPGRGADARRCRRRGGGGRPALAGRGRSLWWARPSSAWPPALPGARFLSGAPAGQRARRPRHGAGSRAPPRSGDARCRARLVHLGLGAGARPTRGSTRPACWPRRPATHRSRRLRPARRVSVPWSLLGAEPLTDFPDRRLAERGLEGAEFVVAVASSARSGSATWPTWSCRLPRPTSGRGTTTNIEGRVSRLGQKLVPPGPGLARLDDRRRAGRAPGCRPRARLSGRRLGRDRAPGPVLPRHHPVGARLPGSGRRRGGAADGHGGVVGPDSGPRPLDPIAIPGVESVERQGAPPRAGLAEPPTGRASRVRRTIGTRSGGRASDDDRLRGRRPACLSRPPVTSTCAHVWPDGQLFDAPGGCPHPLRRRCRRSPPSPALAGLVAPAAVAGQPARPRRPGRRRRWPGAGADGQRRGWW